MHIGGQNGDAIRAVPAKDRAASTVHETCFRVLILCCIATPTGQLTRRLFYRLFHRRLQCLLLRLGHCGLCAASSFFLHRVVHSLPVCTLVHYCSSCVVVASFIMLHSVFWSYQFWRAMQLTQSIIINDQWINHESSMTISRCQSSIVHWESIVNQ